MRNLAEDWKSDMEGSNGDALSLKVFKSINEHLHPRMPINLYPTQNDGFCLIKEEGKKEEAFFLFQRKTANNPELADILTFLKWNVGNRLNRLEIVRNTQLPGGLQVSFSQNIQYPADTTTYATFQKTAYYKSDGTLAAIGADLFDSHKIPYTTEKIPVLKGIPINYAAFDITDEGGNTLSLPKEKGETTPVYFPRNITVDQLRRYLRREIDKFLSVWGKGPKNAKFSSVN